MSTMSVWCKLSFFISVNFILILGVNDLWAQSDKAGDEERTYYEGKRKWKNVSPKKLENMEYRNAPIRPVAYGGIGGAGVIPSISYDARFTENNRLGFRVSTSILFFPVNVNYLFGQAPYYVEAGIGMVGMPPYSRGENEPWTVLPCISLKYRYQHPAKKNFFSVGIEAVRVPEDVLFYDEDMWVPLPTIAWGRVF